MGNIRRDVLVVDRDEGCIAEVKDFLTEEAAFNPVTPYGVSKVKVEAALSKMADADFCPTYLRASTAYGVSPRLRFDLVVNNLTAWAYTTGRVYLKSDGTPWRPLVHVEDICRAYIAVLHAPCELVHNEKVNTTMMVPTMLKQLLDHPDFDNDKFADWGYMQGTRLIVSTDFEADPTKMYEAGSNHGTAVGGVIAAETDATHTVGAAPQCRMLPVKWESQGPYLLISDSKLLTVLNFLAGKVDVMSNSWGSSPVGDYASVVVERIRELAKGIRAFVVPEINMGQIVREVERCAAGQAQVFGANRAGGDILEPHHVLDVIRQAAGREPAPARPAQARAIPRGEEA